MKSSFFSKAVFVTAISCNSLFAQDNGAVEHLNTLNSINNPITTKTWEYTSAVAKDKGARKIDKKRSSLISEMNGAIQHVKNTPAYKGDASYRDSVVAFLEMNKAVLVDDYSKIVDMETVAEESYDLMEAYLKVQEIANEKMQQASDRLNNQLHVFGEKYDIQIIEGEASKMSLRVAQANRMWKYYNEVYLIFFKPYKQEAYFMDAVQRGDVNAMEQNKNSLAEFAKEGLEKLKSISNFDGDASLKESCIAILEFYQEEAEKHFPVLTDFYLKKELFEKTQQAFEKLSKKEQTKEAIEKYNAAITDYNNSTQNYNATNEKLNSMRSKQLDNWNKSTSRFTSKHVK